MKSPLPLPLPLPMPLPMRPVGWNSGLELESPSGISVCYLGLILMLGMLDVGADLHQKKIQQTQNPKNRASLGITREIRIRQASGLLCAVILVVSSRPQRNGHCEFGEQ